MITDEPTQQDQQQALANGLRGTPAPQSPDVSSMSRMQAVGLLAMLSGNKQFEGIGRGLQEQPRIDMQNQLMGQQVASGQREQEAATSPATGAAYKALLGKFGSPVADGASNETLKGILPIAEKGYAAQASADARRDSAKEMAAARMDSAKEMAASRRDVAGVGGGGVGLSDDALEAYAHQFTATGKLPQGRGITPAIGRAIANRASQLAPGADLATNAGSYGADVGSLKKLQTQSDVMNSFESTALKNLNQFLDQAHSVVDTGSPLFNAPARKFQQAVAGDPKMTGFNVARQVAVQEISKVLGGSLGNSAVSDSARHEVEGLIGPDASLAQIETAAKILTQDMANRHGAVNAQLQEIKGRISGKPQAAPASAPATPEASALRKKYGL